jgi:hypothetical protein
MQAIMAASATDHDCACDGESIEDSHCPQDAPNPNPHAFLSHEDSVTYQPSTSNCEITHVDTTRAPQPVVASSGAPGAARLSGTFW